MPRALIVGISGQDGAYLARLLGARGASVWGTTRQDGVPKALSALGIADAVTLRRFDPAASADDEIAALLDAAEPDSIFHLAGASPASGSAGHVSDIGPWVNALRQRAPTTRLFTAVSAAAFGPGDAAASETTPLAPSDRFGAASAAAAQAIAEARDVGLFAAAGLMFAHDSRFGPATSLLQRIVRTAAAARTDADAMLEVGDLEAQADCGWAPEYVDAMLRALLGETAQDYVIASGHSLSVRDMAEHAFGYFKRDWRQYIRAGGAPDAGLLARRGDPARARAELGWRATTFGADLVETLCEGVAAEMQP